MLRVLSEVIAQVNPVRKRENFIASRLHLQSFLGMVGYAIESDLTTDDLLRPNLRDEVELKFYRQWMSLRATTSGVSHVPEVAATTGRNLALHFWRILFDIVHISAATLTMWVEAHEVWRIQVDGLIKEEVLCWTKSDPKFKSQIETLHTRQKVVSVFAKHTDDDALLDLDPRESIAVGDAESSDDESDLGDDETPARTPHGPTKEAKKASARSLKARLIKACALIKSLQAEAEDRLFDEDTAPPSKSTKELFGEESARKKMKSSHRGKRSPRKRSPTEALAPMAPTTKTPSPEVKAPAESQEQGRQGVLEKQGGKGGHKRGRAKA
jgi:hypothetical protein